MHYSQPKKLAFVDKGATLLHSTQIQSVKSKNKNWKNNVVVAWDMTNAQPRYGCPGLLIGMSRDDSTFLTHQNIEYFDTEEEKFSAWDTATGVEIPLENIDPDSYELHQRILISAKERSKLTLQLTDVFGRYSPKALRVVSGYSPDSGAFLDTWAMTPNNRYIIITYSGDEAGFDWASGECIGIEQCKTGLIKGKQRHEFNVNRFQGDPPINFSNEHNLVAISGGNGSFTVYDLNPWRKLREVWVHGFHHVIDFNPKNKWLVAASAQKYIREADESKTLFYIHLLDIESLIQDGAVVQRGKERGVLEENGWVDRLLFHPDGQYLASLLTDDTIHIWDIGNSKLVNGLSLSQAKEPPNKANQADA